jgi:probable rRNA maturation factor
MMKTETALSIPCRQWRAELPDAQAVIETATEAALAGAPGHLDGVAAVEVSVMLADDETMRGLNSRYRGIDKPTNVLSFPIGAADPTPGGEPVLLGDVVLGLETVQKEALAAAKPMAHHVSHLVVHGVLHLLGYDHENDGDAAEMESLETAILARLNIPDPYAIGGDTDRIRDPADA